MSNKCFILQLGSRWKTTEASTSRFAHSLPLDTVLQLPVSSTLPHVEVSESNNITNGLSHLAFVRVCSALRHATHGRRPVDTQTLARRFASAAVLMPDATGAGHSRQRAYWNGVHSISKTLANCFASVLAVRRRRKHPVAILRTPTSFFVDVVSGGGERLQNVLGGDGRFRQTG